MAATPVDCPIHNLPGYECPCEVWMCEHGATVPAFSLKHYWNTNKNREWYDIGGCPCGVSIVDSPEFLDGLRSFLKLKSPAQSGRVSKRTSKGDNPGRWYMFTFTQPEVIKDPHDLIKRAHKVVVSKMVSPNQWCYSLELTEKGTPHIHIRVHTDKYPEFKKIGNFNAGYEYKAEQDKFSTAKYVVKDETKPTPEWLQQNGLKHWFWCSENYTGPKPSVDRVILPDIPVPTELISPSQV